MSNSIVPEVGHKSEPAVAKRNAAPPADWTWAVSPAGTTVTDMATIAEALKIPLPFLVDFRHARQTLEAGELPSWAHTFEAIEGDEGPEIFLDADYGNVEVGIVLCYGRYCAATSPGISVLIDGRSMGEMTPTEMRALAANLETAALAIEGSAA